MGGGGGGGDDVSAAAENIMIVVALMWIGYTRGKGSWRCPAGNKCILGICYGLGEVQMCDMWVARAGL